MKLQEKEAFLYNEIIKKVNVRIMNREKERNLC